MSRKSDRESDNEEDYSDSDKYISCKKTKRLKEYKKENRVLHLLRGKSSNSVDHLTNEQIHDFICKQKDRIAAIPTTDSDNNTIFHIMARKASSYDHRIFSELIDLGFDINQKNKLGETAAEIFFDDTYYDNIAKIGSILKMGASITVTPDKKLELSNMLTKSDLNDDDLRIILGLISECEIQPHDSFLIDLLANPKINVSHLHLAEILLKAEINPNNILRKKHTAFTLTLRNTNPDFQKQMTLLLLKYGANPNLKDETNHAIPLTMIFQNLQEEPQPSIADALELITILIDAGADVDHPLDPFGGGTMLLCMCLVGYDEIVKLLLDKGANAQYTTSDGENNYGTTLLMHVTRIYVERCSKRIITEKQITRLLNIFDHLIQHGAKPNATTTDGKNVFSILFSKWNEMEMEHLYLMVKHLLKADADASNGLIALAQYVYHDLKGIDFIILEKIFIELLSWSKDPEFRQTGCTLQWVLNIHWHAPQQSYNMLRSMLVRGLDPNEFNILPKITQSLLNCYFLKGTVSQKSDIIKLSIMVLDYGANAETAYLHTELQSEMMPIIKAYYRNQLYRTFYDGVLRLLPKFYNRFMYHPDRLRIRILNSQRNLDEACYAKWLEQDVGWLDYLGIYDFQSFQEKMREYARFMD